MFKLIKKWCFDIHGAHRLWLDVLEHNLCAQKIYETQGFVRERILRECDKYEGEYHSVIMMSILKREYQSQS